MLIIRKLSFISVNLKMAPCGTTRICLNHYVSLFHRIYVARKEKMSGSLFLVWKRIKFCQIVSRFVYNRYEDTTDSVKTMLKYAKFCIQVTCHCKL